MKFFKTMLISIYCLFLNDLVSATSLTEINPTEIGQDFINLNTLTQEIEAPFVIKPKEQLFSEEQNIKFVLNKVDLTGVTALSQQNLEKEIEPYYNREVSLNELNELTYILTEKYNKNGFPLARAFLVPQVIKDGHVRIHVIEGNIEQISFEGDKIAKVEKILDRYVTKLLKQKPIQETTLKRYISLIEDIPGIELSEDLQIGGSFEEPILFISISQKPLEYFASADNIVSKTLGPSQFNGSITLNEASTGSKTQLLGMRSQHDKRLELHHFEHEQILGNDGLKLHILRQETQNRPRNVGENESLNAEDRRYSSQNTLLGLTYPFIRSQTKNLLFIGSFDFVRSVGYRNTIGDNIYYDKIRTLTIGIGYEFISPLFGYLGNNNIDISTRKGLNILGAYKGNEDNKPRSITNGKSSFAKLELEFSRLQFLPHDFYLQLAAKGQYTTSELLSSETFNFGGANYGRGYKSSVISGHRGYALKTELGKDIESRFKSLNNWRPYIFYDAGIVYNKDISNQSGSAGTSASSAGLGISLMMLNNKLFSKFEFGKPLTRKSNLNNKHAVAIFKVTIRS